MRVAKALGKHSTEWYHVHYDVDGSERLSAVVFETVAALSGEAVSDLTVRFAEGFDLDALDRLFARRSNGVARRGGRLTFVLDDFEVRVSSEGHVSVRKRT